MSAAEIRASGREAALFQTRPVLRTYAVGGATHVPGDPTYHKVYVWDVLAHAEDSYRGLRYPASGEVKGDVRGRPAGRSLRYVRRYKVLDRRRTKLHLLQQ